MNNNNNNSGSGSGSGSSGSSGDSSVLARKWVSQACNSNTNMYEQNIAIFYIPSLIPRNTSYNYDPKRHRRHSVFY